MFASGEHASQNTTQITAGDPLPASVPRRSAVDRSCSGPLISTHSVRGEATSLRPSLHSNSTYGYNMAFIQCHQRLHDHCQASRESETLCSLQIDRSPCVVGQCLLSAPPHNPRQLLS